MLRNSISIIAQLKWALDIILYRTFFFCCSPSSSSSSSSSFYVPDLGRERTNISTTTHHKEEVDCAICLCNIGDDDDEGGEEIGQLRCKHVFHRVCLDKWLAFQHPTCPLCRDFVAPLRTFTEFGAEILTFKFCAFSENENDHNNWWLR